MKIVVKVPVKPRLGHARTQTGAGTHKTGKMYQRKPKHQGKQFD